MALDRQSIEKRDFPIGRRGYEPEAVDAHLARVADEVEDLRRSASSRAGQSSAASMATAASDQVRAIVEAAERSAADIERAAQEEAERVRSEADADARQTREEAITQSREHVGKVRAATAQMLQRIDAMSTELNGLIDGLRTGANRMTADLALLEEGMAELYDAAGRSRPQGPRIVESMPAAVAPAPVAAAESVEPEPVEPEPVAEAAPSAPAAAGDVEGARLVALNMALSGSSREETDRYLAEHYDLADRAGLLDEVYATVGS